MDAIGQALRWALDHLATIATIVAILSPLGAFVGFVLSQRDARIKLAKRIPGYSFASFVAAAGQGDQNPDIIPLFLRSGIATNLQDPAGRTALVEAVAAEQIKTVRTLVNRRWRIGRRWRFGPRWCDPNCVDRKQHSPLHTAIGAGRRDIYDVLVDAGATPDAASRATVLRLAVANGRVAEVANRIRALEEKEIDIPGDDGRTALAIAVQRPSFAIVHMLLAAHADPNIPPDGPTPLLLATRASLGAIAEELLLARANVDAAGPIGETPLILAAETGNLGIVESLLARDANAATADKRGRTALMAAILGEYPQIVDRLRERTNAGEVEATLILAAGAGDEAKVSECIAAGANLNAQAAGGRSALHDAARQSHTGVGSLLIKSKRVNVDLADDRGNTAYALATEANATKFIALLRNAKADPRTKRADGSTVVMIGAISRHPGVIAEVLKAKLTKEDIETARNDGYTPLMAAVETGDCKVAAQLLEAGANPNAQTANGVSPLMIAITRRDKPMQALLRTWHAIAGEDHGQLLVEARHGNLERVRELLDKARVPVNLTGPRGTTPLLEAVRGGHFEVVNLLIENEADVNHEGGGRTALELAVRGGHPEIVQLLLDREANVNARGRGGKTPLLIACERFNQTILDALLAKRPDVDAADDAGRTPLLVALVNGRDDVEDKLRKKGAAKGELEARLILAARRGDFAAVKALLAENPKFDTPGTAGETALLAASEHAEAEVVEALLEVGAEVNVQGTNGKTPLAMAAQRGSVVLVETLLAAGAAADLTGPDDRTPLAIAAAHGHLEVVQHLLLAKNNPNETDRFKYTALMLAAERGHTEVAAELIAASATIDARGPGGRTPLMFAAEAGHVPVLRLLIDKGSDVKARDADDSTALSLACFAEKPAIVAELVAHGAEVDARDKFKASPLMLAMLAGNGTIEAALRDRGATIGEQEAKLIAAARDGEAGRVRMLLKDPAIMVDAHRRGDDTALIATIANGHSHIARMLLGRGADVNIKGRGGRTALIAASMHSDLALIRALTTHGARDTCEAMDEEWRTAVLATQDPAIRLHLKAACEALQPDDNVFVTSKGHCYHVRQCVHADRETSTLRAAVQEELRPCSACITNQ
ncbi:MAG: ankyrin repeat domain-containing protein [Thermoanaerobaculia bacterium]